MANQYLITVRKLYPKVILNIFNSLIFVSIALAASTAFSELREVVAAITFARILGVIITISYSMFDILTFRKICTLIFKIVLICIYLFTTIVIIERVIVIPSEIEIGKDLAFTLLSLLMFLIVMSPLLIYSILKYDIVNKIRESFRD